MNAAAGEDSRGGAPSKAGAPADGGNTDLGAGGVGTPAQAGDGGASGGAPGIPAEPGGLDRYVDPVAGSDADDGLSLPTAYRTLSRGLQQVPAGATLWLLDGTFGSASGEPSGGVLVVPEGVTVRAINDGAVVVGEGAGAANPPKLLFAGSGALRGVGFDGLPTAVEATTGVVELEALTFKNAGGACDAPIAALVASGDAQVTLTAGGVTEYAGPGSNVQGFANLSDEATLRVVGGSFTDLASPACTPRNHFLLQDGSQLSLESVTIANALGTLGGGILALMGPNTAVSLENSAIEGSVGQAPAIYADGGGSPSIKLVDSSITDNAYIGIMLGEKNGPLTPTVEIAGSTISNCGTAIQSGLSLAPAAASFTVTNSFFNDNRIAGVILNYGGKFHMDGGEVKRNGYSNVSPAFGGFSLRNAIAIDVKLRGVAVTDTPAVGALETAGILINGGSAASVFDFGTAADPGNNDFSGNVRTAIDIRTDVVVSAVGNHWTPNQQASGAAGVYVAPASDKLVYTDGTGTNFFMYGTGSLIVAEAP